ncbi:MAG: phage terminase small subunit P27 family [Candidatus Hodarchaeales archaeon]
MWPCPSYIGEYGNELWHRVGPTLIKAGVLTSLDAETFEILCITYDRIRQFQKILDKEGCIISDARKSQKRHPAVGLLNQYLHTFLKLSEEFRLTPNSRERYGFNWPDENDEDELI